MKIPVWVLGMVLSMGSVAWADEPLVPQTPVPPVHPRMEWNARPFLAGKMRVQNAIRGIVVHHSEGRAPKPGEEATVIRNIQDFHMNDKKWGDIAYHFFITPAGEVFEGRPLKFAGDTGTVYDTTGYEMICFLGSYMKELPTEKALKAFSCFAISEMKRLNLDKARIWGHRDLAATDCPGNSLYKWFTDEFKPNLTDLRNGGN